VDCESYVLFHDIRERIHQARLIRALKALKYEQIGAASLCAISTYGRGFEARPGARPASHPQTPA
jgi:hypothetical protein